MAVLVLPHTEEIHMRSVAQGIAWAKSPAAQYRDGKSWAGWCQSYVFRFGGFTRSAETAYLAFKGSGPVQSKDPTKAPKGALHWWSDGGAGHVAIAIDNDGNAAMASGAVTTSWGVAQGSVSVNHYIAVKPGLKYLGWTFDMLGQRLPDVDAFIKAETQKEAAAAARAKAEKAAAAKAAAEKAAAEKAAADQKAHEAALADAAEHAIPDPEATMFLPLVRAAGKPEVYLLVRGVQKVHITHDQWLVYKAIGATIHDLPAGALDGFKTVTS